MMSKGHKKYALPTRETEKDLRPWIPKISGAMIMHRPRPIPRRENETKSFDDDLIARTLSNAADIRMALKFSRGELFLDVDGRRSDPEKATQASTYGCIQLASMALCPDDSLDARDLRCHAATRFQRRIGCGIETYDNDPNTTGGRCHLEKTALQRSVEAAVTPPTCEKAAAPGPAPTASGPCSPHP